MDRNGKVIKLDAVKDAIDNGIVDVEEWLKRSSLTLFANISTNRVRYQLHLPVLSTDRSLQTVYHVVNVDIDSVQYLELSPYTDVDQTKSIGRYSIGEVELISAGGGLSPSEALLEVFSQLKIDTTSVRGKVLEFLYRFSPSHYQALDDSPLLRSKLGDNSPLLAMGRTSSSSSVNSHVYATQLLHEAAVNLFFSRKCNYGCKLSSLLV